MQKLQKDESVDAFGVTVGKKPSAAGSYVGDPSEVMELLNTLSRNSKQQQTHTRYFSSIDLPSQKGNTATAVAVANAIANTNSNNSNNTNTNVSNGVDTFGLANELKFNAAMNARKQSAANSEFNYHPKGLGGGRALSMSHLPSSDNSNNNDGESVQGEGHGIRIQRTLSSARLTINGYFESISSKEKEDDDDGIFF